MPAGAECSLSNIQENKTNKTCSNASSDITVTEIFKRTSSCFADHNLILDSSSELTTDNNYQHVPHLNIKPSCNCTQCDIWTHEQNPKLQTKNLTFTNASQPDRKNLLYKTEIECDNKVNIVSLNYNSMTTIEKQTQMKILVHR